MGMASSSSYFFLFLFLFLSIAANANAIDSTSSNISITTDPKPTPWPDQFHSLLIMNNTSTNEVQVAHLWYDWPNRRNIHLIQYQLGKLLYDVEWSNGTSYFYTLHPDIPECRTAHLEVGILRPNWLDGASYLGQQHVDGFLCNVWTKADFIWYYEDVVTRRPVHWVFYTGRAVNVMTFDVGAVLEDSKWQAPIYCFDKDTVESQTVGHPQASLRSSLPLSFM
ncbi:hypothetical protein BVRB_3g068960 [Beta vulgaris subsp. vulgaris]|nr:hypothetical protein BVRB_3g068960 [Beta vulgaris subsp. vulgaris]